jgi:chemotaxis-related protein WspB
MHVHVLYLVAGGQRYALPTRHVVEVVPAVGLRLVPDVPAAVAGLLHYRGQVLPVVDLARRLGAAPAPRALATRIVVCEREDAVPVRPGKGGAGDASWAANVGRTRPLLGILAADVTRVGTLDPDAPGSHAGPVPEGPSTLGRVTSDEEGLVQLVTLDGLIGADVLARLDAAAVEGAP